MIYDMFSFFNELDVLEERLQYLYNHVDYFVLCESDTTHVGEKKCLYYKDNKNRFEKYENKIIHVVFRGNSKVQNAWENENLQRNYLIENINLTNDDKIMISDVDEIPSINFISKLSRYDGSSILIAIQELSYFWPNYRRNDLPYWMGGTRGFNFKYLEKLKCLNENYSSTFLASLNKGTTLTKVRLTNVGLPINNGGWHLSYMGGKNSIKSKISSFAHTEEKERIGIDFDKFIDNFIITGSNFFGKNETYINYGTFKYIYLIPYSEQTPKLSFLLRQKWYFQKNTIVFKIKLKYYAEMLLWF